MSGYNRVIICGRLGKDPEVKSFQNGGKIATFSVATSETWNDKASGERKERTEWHTIKVDNERLVETASRYLRKGSEVLIEGTLQTRKWQDQSGQDRYSTEVVVGRFNGTLALIGGRQDGGSQEREAPTRGGGGAMRGSFPTPDGFSDDADDIPFATNSLTAREPGASKRGM